MRIAYRDPARIPERLTLQATRSLAEPSREWAEKALRERPDSTPAEIADDLRAQSARIARVDGAVAGTPFFIALVPGYVSYLWQEARMGLRTAALFGHDPATMRTAAEMLALRGVHRTVEEAQSALAEVADKPPPVEARRSLRTWMTAIRYVLVFGGFLGPPEEREGPSRWRDRARAAAGFVFGLAIWATTWIFPLTFMIALAWGCEAHCRQLGMRTLALYGGGSVSSAEAIERGSRREDKGHTKRQVIRSIALALSVAIPVAFVAYANHVRQDTGITLIAALGALVALSLVVAGAVYGSRR